MGDIADWMLDQALISHWDDPAYDTVEDLPRQKTCAYCNKPRLHWQMTEKGWRLFDENNNMHSCSKHALATRVRDNTR